MFEEKESNCVVEECGKICLVEEEGRKQCGEEKSKYADKG